MENELLNVFDQHMNQIGVATRKEVHKKGLWHETFQCWLISKEAGRDYIYLQIRSDSKKDFPSMMDITAAGHLLAHETIEEGVREVQEELGIGVSFAELIHLGVMKDCIIQESFIDQEYANVFLYPCKTSFDEFQLQREEVAGIVKVEFECFYDFCLGSIEELRVDGFEINSDGDKIQVQKTLNKSTFVPHQRSYLIETATAIHHYIKINKHCSSK